MSSSPLLQISRLCVSFPDGRADPVRAVNDLDLDVRAGERVGLVGHSGSGKSATGLAILGLHSARTTVTGSVRFDGEELVGRSDRWLSRLRGRRLAWMGQDALAAFTPVFEIGRQVAEALQVHDRGLGSAAARRQAVDLLEEVGLDDPSRAAAALPGELSGGMRQRAALAMALANGPDLVIADEPTSALDSIRQAEIVQLIRERCAQLGTALIFITHELRVVADLCDRIAVLDRGSLVECGPTQRLLDHPATAALRRMVAASAPAHTEGESEQRRGESTAPVVLRVVDLERHFEVRSTTGRELIKAVDGVSLEINAGESVALVGESGSGKSTVLHEVASLRAPAAGEISVTGHNLGSVRRSARRALRREVQVVLQDPASSLNPRLTVAQIISEPMRIRRVGRAERAARLREVMAAVDLPADQLRRRPGQLSGGQRQRVAMARALSVSPRLLLLDEPVSALDAPLRVEIMQLLERLRHSLGLAYLITSHDLPLTLRYADRVAVMRHGKIVDQGTGAELRASTHPYTRLLFAAGGIRPAQLGKGSVGQPVEARAVEVVDHS